MKRKEEAMKKYIASFLAICMIFVMVPILPAEAAGLEDTEIGRASCRERV